MIRRKDDGLFAFAGLWEHLEAQDSASMESCRILTCEPDEMTGELHSRMPVILPADRYEDWLNPAAQGEPLQAHLRPYEERGRDGSLPGEQAGELPLEQLARAGKPC